MNYLRDRAVPAAAIPSSWIQIGQEPEIAPGVQGYTVDRGPGGLYVPLVIAIDEGSGAVGRYLDSLPRDRRVVFPCVISERLVRMLARRGFFPASEWNPDLDEPVEVWVREP